MPLAHVQCGWGTAGPCGWWLVVGGTEDLGSLTTGSVAACSRHKLIIAGLLRRVHSRDNTGIDVYEGMAFRNVLDGETSLWLQLQFCTCGDCWGSAAGGLQRRTG